LPITLARKLGCPVEVAVRIISAYYGRAETASRYIRRVLAVAKKVGYAETYFGRRRYCPDYQNLNGNGDACHELEKTLWNHICAGSSAEFLKWKQVRVWEALRQIGFTKDDVRLAIQLYDECIWMVRDEVLQEVREITEEIWRKKEKGFLQFQTEVKVGKSWKEVS